MKIKTLATYLVLSMQAFIPLSTAVAAVEENQEEEVVESDFYETSFVISAYYSPLLGQEHYVTGSYEGDIRLNGGGVRGADGTPVYPGMIAAPKKYAFGTKMDIPGIGMTSVHDRGGAIVSTAGHETRGYAYDRLDVWMGSGDEGLRRALNWGKRTVNGVKVYGVRDDFVDSVYLQELSNAEIFIQGTILSPLTFPRDIYFGSNGGDVTKMQGYLVEWGYLRETTGFYGEETAEAIFQFQLDFVESVSDADDLGAGHFGINTRRAFDKLIHDKSGSLDTLKVRQGSLLMKDHLDLLENRTTFGRGLGLGDSGEDVKRLQEELNRLGYLRIDATGSFGETTEHALFKFQQARGIVADKSADGAGFLGPKTRSELNSIVLARFETKSLLAYEREEIKAGRHIVLFPDELIATVRKDEQ